MKARNTSKTRSRDRAQHPLAKLDLRVQVTQDEILADLLYPASPGSLRRRP